MIFLDTSVLVAASQKQHSNHHRCLTLVGAADRSTTACSLHSLAETYNVLSGMPRPFRLPPSAALAIVRQVRERVRTISLTESEYLATIESLVPRGLMGGIVYDALLMRCARKVDAQTIYTLNPGDWALVDAELAERVTRP